MRRRGVATPVAAGRRNAGPAAARRAHLAGKRIMSRRAGEGADRDDKATLGLALPRRLAAQASDLQLVKVTIHVHCTDLVRGRALRHELRFAAIVAVFLGCNQLRSNLVQEGIDRHLPVDFPWAEFHPTLARNAANMGYNHAPLGSTNETGSAHWTKYRVGTRVRPSRRRSARIWGAEASEVDSNGVWEAARTPLIAEKAHSATSERTQSGRSNLNVTSVFGRLGRRGPHAARSQLGFGLSWQPECAFQSKSAHRATREFQP